MWKLIKVFLHSWGFLEFWCLNPQVNCDCKYLRHWSCSASSTLCATHWAPHCIALKLHRAMAFHWLTPHIALATHLVRGCTVERISPLAPTHFCPCAAQSLGKEQACRCPFTSVHMVVLHKIKAATAAKMWRDDHEMASSGGKEWWWCLIVIARGSYSNTTSSNNLRRLLMALEEEEEETGPVRVIAGDWQ